MKKRIPAHQQQAAGFTLVEIAIVLVVVSLLLAALMGPLAAQQEQKAIMDTRRQMDEIKEAMLGFLAAQGRLPCPATATLPDTNPNAGLEAVATCGATDPIGVVPWKTLGLRQTDAWGRRFTYQVTGTFAASAVTVMTQTGDMTILDSAGGNAIISGPPPVSNNGAVSVIISHGKNGYGAYLPNGIKTSVGPDASESENSDGDTTYVSKYAAGANPTDYDDLTLWLSPTVVMNRLVNAGKLP